MRTVFYFLIIVMLCSYSHSSADAIDPLLVQWPDYIMKIQRPDSLVPYLSSKMEIERCAACIRIGELRDKKYFIVLLSAFNKEESRPGLDLSYGVKYYSLIGLANLDG